MDKHLVLISGGGFSTEENSYIDNFALNLCSSKNQKKNVVFIATASHDAEGYIEKFNYAFREHHTFHLTNSTLMFNDCLDQADLIYIGGGDIHYLIDTWRKIGFDKKIIELYEKGTVIVGVSAGAMCWFDYIHDSKRVSIGLNVLKGSMCPHYDDLNDEKKSYDEWAKQNSNITHYKLNNNESLHVKDGKIVARIVT
ncbi:Type 1 glutamine amidotransferase-like domain-containing protein [Vagococcus fluvialis]|uniref:Type 1 glutamine amidotransferase-like domain-containing protein n=1 Tax=Vagococcus fluvialis TaxID=2738 RepID=UPI0037A8DA19